MTKAKDVTVEKQFVADAVAVKELNDRIQLLWVNPSPTSGFAAQTIPLSITLSNHLILIVFTYATGTYPKILTGCYYNGDVNTEFQGVYTAAEGSTGFFTTRSGRVTANSIIFDDGHFRYFTGNDAVWNGRMVPIMACAIKM